MSLGIIPTRKRLPAAANDLMPCCDTHRPALLHFCPYHSSKWTKSRSDGRITPMTGFFFKGIHRLFCRISMFISVYFTYFYQQIYQYSN